MLNADVFYQQHAELIALAEEITAACGDDRTIARDADPIRRSLSRLMGKLGVHLAIEDDYLYPRLKDHANAVVRNTAIRFEAEMSGLKPAFQAFKEKWTSDAIGRDPAAFRAELGVLFAALGHRVERENSLLYPYLGEL
ncbi:MAG: hemerythrin domain-containing protein [Elsteraceae bacterium]